MMTERFANVWDALEDTSEEVASMRLRSELTVVITEKVKSWNLTQKDSAAKLGVTQPRLNDLLRGRINKFSIDTLVNLAVRAGMKVDIKIF